MGWNKHYLFISNETSNFSTEILDALDLKDYKDLGEVEMENFDDSAIYSANYADCIIIHSPIIVYKFLNEEETILEENFKSHFPESKIAVGVQLSSSEYFGFCVIEKGKRIRVKTGVDGKIKIDQGKPIQEEKESYERLVNYMDEREKEELKYDNGEKGYKDYLEFESSWRVANMVSKSFIGAHIDRFTWKEIKFRKFVK